MADRKYTPTDAPKETLFALHKFLGIDHGVIVHTAQHGTDNSVTEDALADTNGAYRATALVAVDVSDAELKRLERRRISRRALSLHAASRRRHAD